MRSKPMKGGAIDISKSCCTCKYFLFTDKEVLKAQRTEQVHAVWFNGLCKNSKSLYACNKVVEHCWCKEWKRFK